MSSGAGGFVKRSKPRSSASRISSTYDDDEDVTAGPSSISVGPIQAMNNGATSSSKGSRRAVDEFDDQGEEDVAGPSVVFRSRAKGARGTPSSSAAASSSRSGSIAASASKLRSAASAMVEDDLGDDGDAFEVRRTKLTMAGKPARRSAADTSSSTGAPGRSTPLRPTSFQAIPSNPSEVFSSTASSLYTSKYLEELRSSTPTSRSRAQSPTPAQPVGPGTRIDDPMVAQTSRMALEDHDDGDLARSKFAADFAHDAIPSESVIRAAKEKRAKLRAAASNAATSASEDFISLTPFSKSSALKRYDAMEVDDGPHPHSRLQREEDELGDGEDEFAEFTGATERIPIGEKAEKEWNVQQRREMEAAVRGDFDQDAVVEDEMDEDEEEWERAQLRRTQNVTQSTSHSRETSPFRPAPIPAAVPLPSVGTCSTRLELTLRALEQSTAANAAVIESSTKELETIEAGEAENKSKVTEVEDKASWFNELDEFVGSLARFMEEKIDRIEEVEKQALDLLVKRNSMLSKRMGRWLDAKLEVSLGVRLAKSAVIDLAEEQDDEIESAGNGHSLPPPTEAPQVDRLDPADEQSFTLAQRELAETRRSIFADVQAVEYVDPGALTGLPPRYFGHLYPERSSPKPTDYDAHPRSVVARFEEWRRRYPDEYAQVWGGLSLAQIWEFYARHEMCLWTPFFQLTASGEEMDWYEGAICLPEMEWYKGAVGYVKRAAADAQTVVGGDDEVLTTIIANVLVGHLITLANKGAFSPWFAEHSKEAVETMEAVVRVLLGADHVRYVSLVEAYLEVFRAQIGRLKEVMGTGMQMSSGDEGARAAAEVVDALVQRLLKNLVAWSKAAGINDSVASGPSTVLAKTFMGLVETLVLDVVEEFAAMTGPREITLQARRQVFDVLPSPIVAKSERLTLLAQSLT